LNQQPGAWPVRSRTEHKRSNGDGTEPEGERLTYSRTRSALRGPGLSKAACHAGQLADDKQTGTDERRAQVQFRPVRQGECVL